MLHLNKIHGISATILALAIAQTANAAPTNISDDYWGGNAHGYGDVIGADAYFDILSMDVELLANDWLHVSINTNFAGRGDDGLYDGTSQVNLTDGLGIGYGDLFLSSSWNPDDSVANYANDNYIAGTVWEYAFSLDDRWMSENLIGSGSLFQLNPGVNPDGTLFNDDVLLSEDFLTGGTFRNGQEIAADENGDAVFFETNSYWDITAGTSVNFYIDLSRTALAGSDSIALHWGMTCGNDTIEGEYQKVSVPEPAVLGLLALGLTGMGMSKRRKS